MLYLRFALIVPTVPDILTVVTLIVGVVSLSFLVMNMLGLQCAYCGRA